MPITLHWRRRKQPGTQLDHGIPGGKMPPAKHPEPVAKAGNNGRLFAQSIQGRPNNKFGNHTFRYPLGNCRARCHHQRIDPSLSPTPPTIELSVFRSKLSACPNLLELLPALIINNQDCKLLTISINRSSKSKSNSRLSLIP